MLGSPVLGNRACIYDVVVLGRHGCLLAHPVGMRQTGGVKAGMCGISSAGASLVSMMYQAPVVSAHCPDHTPAAPSSAVAVLSRILMVTIKLHPRSAQHSPELSLCPQDKAVGPTDRLTAPLWGHMGARGVGLPPIAANAGLNGRMDGLGLSRASAGGPIGAPLTGAPGLARMSVGLYHTETAGGEILSLSSCSLTNFSRAAVMQQSPTAAAHRSRLGIPPADA